ncbi:hypothetical protein EMIT0158MI4_270046 [Burkholderia ambifaria]
MNRGIRMSDAHARQAPGDGERFVVGVSPFMHRGGQWLWGDGILRNRGFLNRWSPRARETSRLFSECMTTT